MDAPDQIKPANKRSASSHPTSHRITSLHSARRTLPSPEVTFQRCELDMMLQVYGRMVGAGEWRDYAIDMLKDRAVFSVFKRSSEVPLFSIEKTPKLARRQGAWAVTNASGHILKRGYELKNVLKVFDKKPRLIAV